MSKFKTDGNYEQTLCFDCKNATRPWKCPWVAKYAPVPGWLAEKTQLCKRSSPYDSYYVKACPRFKRDSYCGGTVNHPETGRVYVDPKDVSSIAEAICEQAVADWIAIDYGNLSSLKVSGSTVKRDKMLEFFFSAWFAQLLESFTEYTPQQIRRSIRIPGESVMTWREAPSK